MKEIIKGMVGIYKITNPENKIYIGQSKNLPQRYSTYRDQRDIYGRLRDSFKKYGFKAHKFEVIEYCEIKELNEKEVYYMKKLNTVLTPHGLNMKIGGNNATSGNMVKQEDEPSEKPILYFSGSDFKYMRKSKKLSVYRLSELSNVSEITIYNYEAGKTEPSIKVYRRLVKALAEFKAGQP